MTLAKLRYKIGDTITVTVSNDPERFVEDYGCVFTSTTKDFKCTAVDQYVSKTADIKEDTLNAMKSRPKMLSMHILQVKISISVCLI